MIIVGNISASRRETRGVGGIGRVCRPVTPRDLPNLGIPPPLPPTPPPLSIFPYTGQGCVGDYL